MLSLGSGNSGKRQKLLMQKGGKRRRPGFLPKNLPQKRPHAQLKMPLKRKKRAQKKRRPCKKSAAGSVASALT